MTSTLSLDVLDTVRIASPCPMRWEDLESRGDGADRVRHCGVCNLHVYNLSNMTRDEAEAVVRSREPGARFCAGMYRKPDGSILTRDCPVGRAMLRRRAALVVVRVAAAVAGMLTAGIFAARGERTVGSLRHREPFSELTDLVKSAKPPPVIPIQMRPMPSQYIMGRVSINGCN
jgi:hypothetical protein